MWSLIAANTLVCFNLVNHHRACLIVKESLYEIIFDADNTLFDFDRAEETALIKTLMHFDMPNPPGLIGFYRNTLLSR